MNLIFLISEIEIYATNLEMSNKIAINLFGKRKFSFSKGNF